MVRPPDSGVSPTFLRDQAFPVDQFAAFGVSTGEDQVLAE
jgi:hypothetical protein